MGHSVKCRDLKTYWNNITSQCVSCAVHPGYEVTPNCGRDDDGGLHEPPFTACKENVTFNDGSSAYCRPCSSCPPGINPASPCSTTSNTKCPDPGSGATGVPFAEPATRVFSAARTTTQGSSFKPNAATVPTPLSTYPHQHVGMLWVLPFSILISIMLVVLCVCLICVKRKRGQHTGLSYHRKSSYINAGFAPLSAGPGNHDLEHFLSPDILLAPLQTVLDNLDVLEELVILLDPENQGIKNTKHLASHCSFPATWVTYTYSMKASKSPLKALLEGVTSRHPDWTVGHLAKLLKHMERNDAIAVLTKLGGNVKQVKTLIPPLTAESLSLQVSDC